LGALLEAKRFIEFPGIPSVYAVALGPMYTGDKLWNDSFFITMCSIGLNGRVYTVESSSEVLKCTSDLHALICACVVQRLQECMHTFTCIVIVSVHASIEALMMLSEDADIRKSPVCSNALQFSNNARSSKPQTKKVVNVWELPLKAKPREEIRHGGFLPVGNFAPKSKETTGYEDWFVT
jgi:hypothetical protein